jgi:hypothetical protein
VAVFSFPVVFAKSALKPVAVLCPTPEVVKFPAFSPTNVFDTEEEQQAWTKGVPPNVITPTLDLAV